MKRAVTRSIFVTYEADEGSITLPIDVNTLPAEAKTAEAGRASSLVLVPVLVLVLALFVTLVVTVTVSP